MAVMPNQVVTVYNDTTAGPLTGAFRVLSDRHNPEINYAYGTGLARTCGAVTFSHRSKPEVFLQRGIEYLKAAQAIPALIKEHEKAEEEKFRNSYEVQQAWEFYVESCGVDLSYDYENFKTILGVKSLKTWVEKWKEAENAKITAKEDENYRDRRREELSEEIAGPGSFWLNRSSYIRVYIDKLIDAEIRENKGENK